MPNIPSTIPTAKAALVALLAGASWDNDLPEAPVVCYGEPKDRPRIAVIVGDTSGAGDANQEWAALGAHDRAEQYALGLKVIVNVPGMNQATATETAFAVFATVEDEIREDPTLVNIGVDARNCSIEIRQPVHVEEATEAGFAAAVVSAVRCTARI